MERQHHPHNPNPNEGGRERNKSWVTAWFKRDWRVVAAAVYLVINLFDFIIFPILSMVLPHYIPGLAYHPWEPMTTMNGGLFHLAFGAILGVSAWRSPQFDQTWRNQGGGGEGNYPPPAPPPPPPGPGPIQPNQ